MRVLGRLMVVALVASTAGILDAGPAEAATIAGTVSGNVCIRSGGGAPNPTGGVCDTADPHDAAPAPRGLQSPPNIESTAYQFDGVLIDGVVQATSGGVTRTAVGVIDVSTVTGGSAAENSLGGSGTVASAAVPATFGCSASLVGGTSVDGDFFGSFVRALTTVNVDLEVDVNVYAGAGCAGAVSAEAGVDVFVEAEFIPTAVDASGHAISASFEGAFHTA